MVVPVVVGHRQHGCDAHGAPHRGPGGQALILPSSALWLTLGGRQQAQQNITVNAAGSEWIKLNYDQTGFYRVLYPAHMQAA